MRYLLSAINAKYIHSNPAVYSLYAYATSRLKDMPEKVPEIIICEHTINNHIDEILEDIYTKQPDVIGFSCYIWNITFVDMLIKEINKLLPDTHIWVGGPEVSYRAMEYLRYMPMVKGVIVGEGEETFYQLVKAYEANSLGKPDSIKGIVFYDDNNVICNNGYAPVMDLDHIPFFYNDLDAFSNRIIYYESSRGCPFSCSYCLSSIDKQIRSRSMELVKKELLFFIEHKVPQVKFIDRTFNCNPTRAMDIWSFIKDNDNGITNFHFEIAADLLTDEQIDLVSTFRPGLIQFEIGIQSTNEDTLKAIHRVTNLGKIAENVAKIKQSDNIHQHLDLIAGLPMEDIYSFKKSFNDVYAMKPDQLQLGFLKVLSGSFMKENASDYELIFRSYPPYELLSTKWLSHGDVIRLKHIENVVEIYYNSNQFHNSMEYLCKYFSTAFDMYDSLGEYYFTNFDTKAKHSRISRYNLLLDFYRHIVSKNNIEAGDEYIFRQVLTLDVYLRENIKTRPDFALDLKDYHKILIQLKKDYSLPNQAHIEVFIENGITNFVLFDYEKRHPLTMDADLKLLKYN